MAAPSTPPLAPETRPVGLRLLDFIEHPFFLWAASIVAGLVGFFVYPVLLVCGACVLLAFHRAKDVRGLSLRWQLLSYCGLFVLTTAGLLGIGILIKRNVPQLATLNDIRDLVLRQSQNKTPNSPEGKTDPLRSVPSHIPKAPVSSEEMFIGKVEVQLVSPPGSSTNFARMYQTSSGCSVDPIQLLLFIRLTNNSDREKMITRYVVESGSAKTNGWFRLRRVDLRSGFLITFGLKDKPARLPPIGTVLDFPSGNRSTYGFMVPPKAADYNNSAVLKGNWLDEQVGNTNLPPGHSVLGWSAFQYMNKSGKEGLDMRITITDELGNNYKVTSPQIFFRMT